jgi:hypothetical protein
VKGKDKDKKDREDKPGLGIPKKLMSKPLSDFRFMLCTEVYRVDEDGKEIESIIYLASGDVAKAYAGQMVDPEYYKTREVSAITDGEDTFLVGKPIHLSSEEETLVNIRAKALGKLTEAERRVLGLFPRD